MIFARACISTMILVYCSLPHCMKKHLKKICYLYFFPTNTINWSLIETATPVFKKKSILFIFRDKSQWLSCQDMSKWFWHKKTKYYPRQSLYGFGSTHIVAVKKHFISFKALLFLSINLYQSTMFPSPKR